MRSHLARRLSTAIAFSFSMALVIQSPSGAVEPPPPPGFQIFTVNAPPDPVATDVIAEAIARWDAVLDIDPAVPVVVEVEWIPVDPSDPGEGSAFEFILGSPGEPLTPSALANREAGLDLNGPDPEILLYPNPDHDWFISLDPLPEGSEQSDLMSFIMREIGVSLGFLGSASEEPGGPTIDRFEPHRFDTLVSLGGVPVLDLDESDDPVTLTSGQLEIAIGGDQLFPIESEAPFVLYSTFDKFGAIAEGEPGFLMSSSLGPGASARSIDAPVLGVLSGIGWPLKTGTLGAEVVSVAIVDDEATVELRSTTLLASAAPAASVRVDALVGGVVVSSITVSGAATSATLDGLPVGAEVEVLATAIAANGTESLPGSRSLTDHLEGGITSLGYTDR